MPIDIQNIGMMLSGMGQGLNGQGPEFQRNLMLQRQLEDNDNANREAEQKKLAAERQKTLFTDAEAQLRFAKEGRWDLVGQLAQSRLQLSENFPGVDFSATKQLAVLAQYAEQGNEEARSKIMSTLENGVEIGRAYGVLDMPEGPTILKGSDVDDTGQYVERDAEGNVTAKKVQGWETDTATQDGAAADRSLRERQLALQATTEARQSTKLSAGLEKALLDSQDRVVEAQRNANEYTMLAKDFERLPNDGGAKTSFTEGLKSILGTQDDVTEFRRRFNKVRLSEGLKNLPPGPATDRDVQEAFKGVPPENAPPEQVQSFLRGAARLARFEASYNQFKADFISKESTGRGLNQAWRATVRSPKLGREISIAEIYETAQNRGITPEDVKAQLGIQ